MVKRIISLFLLITLVFSLTACSNFSFSEMYFSHLHSSVPMEDWTDAIPAHRVLGGKEKQKEIDELARELLKTYFDEKYETWVKIHTIHVIVDFDVETKGSILPVEVKHTPVFSGEIVAECELNDKKFAAYVDTSSEEKKCFDNYQGDQIINDVKEYFIDILDANKIICDVRFPVNNGMNGLTLGHAEKYELSNMFHNVYDGDVEEFIRNDGANGQMSINCICYDEEGIEITSEQLDAFKTESLRIVCFEDLNMFNHYHNSDNNDINSYWPYLSCSFVSQKKANKTWQNKSAILFDSAELKELDGFYYATPHLEYEFEKDFEMKDGLAYDIEHNLFMWVREVKESVVEQDGDQTIHKTNKKNIPVVVTDVFDYPNEDVYVFFKTSDIKEYDSNKTYKLCTYTYDANHPYQAETDDLTVIGEYVVIEGNHSNDCWFIVEVLDPVEEN